MLGLLAALDEIERIAGGRRPVEQFIEDRHEPRVQIAGANLRAFQHQVVELDRAGECLVRRVGKAHALRPCGAGKHVDDHAPGKLGLACARIAQPLDQRIDGIDDVGPEKLRQDEIAVAIPFFPLLGTERASARARRSAARRQGDGVLHRQILRELPGSGNISR